ncbi:hypothetical protein BU16DRAFT_563968 [Lophium mytilinum]|uniref:Uncharacterized protein n=1 Tax=Lophium mytilinum TaxID=390894 RepID=A0A6A6QKU8_9PEZI|nr:hypothetical protein BU16DRAFT_563968 [Lophium mytilinum]
MDGMARETMLAAPDRAQQTSAHGAAVGISVSAGVPDVPSSLSLRAVVPAQQPRRDVADQMADGGRALQQITGPRSLPRASPRIPLFTRREQGPSAVISRSSPTDPACSGRRRAVLVNVCDGTLRAARVRHLPRAPRPPLTGRGRAAPARERDS